MAWNVTFSSKAAKQAAKLSRKQRDILLRLVVDLQMHGPVAAQWPNYSRLGKDEYHCHLSYRWVACWRVHRSGNIIELYYAGSRENAPY